MRLEKKSFLKTSAYAVFSQLVSLVCGLATSLLLPKVMGVDQYGYWQYFFLYSSYVGILHFGFNDGVYLKLGGKRFTDINKSEIYPQLLLISALQIVIGLAVGTYGYLFQDGPYKEIAYFLSLYIIVENIYKTLSFVLMSTDGMQYYSKTVIIDKASFILFLFIFLVLLHQYSFEYVITVYLLARVVALTCVFGHYGKICTSQVMPIVLTTKNLFAVWNNMATGVSLTISNLLSTFIIGSGRFFVEYSWGISVFAKISFAVSLSMFVLTFISQIGLVLFPYLCRMDSEKQSRLLDVLTFTVGLFAFCCFIGFVPLNFIVKEWLPKYEESLGYLMLLCPIALFETRMVLIYTTYFKTLKKQVVLLKINMISVVFAMVCYSLSANVLGSINMLVFSMLLSIMLRSYLCQIYLYRKLNQKLDKLVISIEILASFMLVLSYNILGSITLFVLCYVISLSLLIVTRKNKIAYCYSLFRK